MKTKTFAAAAILVMSLSAFAAAQDATPAGAPPQDAPTMGHGMGRGEFHGAAGQITAIEGSVITLQSFNGETAKAKVSPSTRIRKEGADAKFSDLKVGDRVMVSGQQDASGVWNAEVVRSGRGGGPMGGAQANGRMNPADNGKTYIFGEVTKIEGTKITVKKPDSGEQVIEVDDNTSFRNDRRESITLADVKVGNVVRGQGAVKDGIFVPQVLNAGARRPAMGHGPGAPPNAAASDDSAQPKSAAPDSTNSQK
jgi:hypothetical protein